MNKISAQDFHGEIMKFASALICAAMMLAFSIAPAPADECDDIITALQKHGDDINPKDAKSTPQFCASVGQLHGLMVSIREIARQCFDSGSKRSDVIKAADEGIKGMQELMDKQCK